MNTQLPVPNDQQQSEIHCDPANADEVLGIEQAAQLANKSVSTMYWLRQTGQGPRSGKLGRRVVYRRSDVLAWVESAFESGGTA
jgi:predicted DNA-binding transcriptional regulator AlpA